MRIDDRILIAIAKPSPPPGTDTARHLAASLRMAGIHDKGTQIAFLAQLGTESGGFRYLSEIWGPSAAQKTYETRLGNSEPGDGYKYRGRGWIQITGKANYRAAGDAIGIDLVRFPDRASEPAVAAKIAAWYWRERVASKGRMKAEPLDSDEQLETFERITRAINGGTNGLADRQRRFEAGVEAARGRSVLDGDDTLTIILVVVVVLVAVVVAWHYRAEILKSLRKFKST